MEAELQFNDSKAAKIGNVNNIETALRWSAC